MKNTSQQYLNSEAHGYLMEAKACKLLLKDLERDVYKRQLLPMGTLANGDLRHKRILAHRALKKLQQDCHMEKWEVYIWLQAKLGLDAHQTHIGQFSEYMCEQVISLCQQAPAYTSGRAA